MFRILHVLLFEYWLAFGLESLPLEEIYKSVSAAVDERKDIASLIEIGKSYENRSIYVVKISNPHPRPTHVAVAEFGNHAREWASHASGLYAVQQLLKKKKAVAGIEWYIIPVLNPDGYEYSWKDGNRMWRKNRGTNENSNCVGVDLNRNFPVGFGSKADGRYSCSEPCEITYQGQTYLSEPESIALHRFLKNFNNISLYLSVHSCSQMILYPFGYTNEESPVKKDLLRFADRIKEAMQSVAGTPYRVLQASELYVAGGATDDWAHYDLCIPQVFTIELGREMVEPLKLGIKLDPPALILVYKMWGRLRLRRMPVRNLWPNTSTKFILEDVRARHEILLGVSDESICRMIEILKAHKGGVELDDAVGKVTKTPLIKIEEVIHQNDNEPVKEEVQKANTKSLKEKPERPKILLLANGDKKKDKPYSFMEKRVADEDTDFDANDDLPLDELEGNSDEDFWR